MASKKSQVSMELLLLIGLVVVVFLLIYDYDYNLEKNSELISRHMNMLKECNHIADKIALVNNMGWDFEVTIADIRYNMIFIGTNNQLTLTDSEKSASATCKVPLAVFGKSPVWIYDVADFEINSGALTIRNNKGNIEIDE
ncbi:MAG: hypothetical protein ABIG89_03170 [Candidatus Woesearchaeota archaeon]